MTTLFDPYRPDVAIFTGREAFTERVISAALSRRCVLLFGGRQSGKTTVLLRIAADLKKSIPRDALDTYACPVYVDLTALPVEAKSADFFGLLLTAATESCASSIRGFIAPRCNGEPCPTIEVFADRIHQITSSAGDVDLTLLFLLDEAERVLGERFPRGFQDNLFSILYGPDLSTDAKLAMVFSGAQALYKFSEDETSPIGSRAAYLNIRNFDENSIGLYIAKLKTLYGIVVPDLLVPYIFSLGGGHAGLTARLCAFINENNITTNADLESLSFQFQNECKQLFRLWATSLSSQARALHDKLLSSSAMTRQKIAEVFRENQWDPLLAEKAIEELMFTGIAQFDGTTLTDVNQFYWAYLRDALPTTASDNTNISKNNRKDEAHDGIWGLIEQAEIALRSYVNFVYAGHFGDELEAKIRAALGDNAMQKVLANVLKSNERYKHTARDRALGVFDGLYLGQLGQLMIWKEAWPLFSHLTQDKRELEMLLAPINAVRTDKAHFYDVPMRELLRCKLHCEDLIGLIEKHLPKNAV